MKLELKQLISEVENLADTLEAKNNNVYIGIKNDEVMDLFKQGKFIRFNYGCMYIPRVSFIDRLSDYNLTIDCYNDVSHYYNRSLIGRETSIKEYAKKYLYDIDLMDLYGFSIYSKKAFLKAVLKLFASNYQYKMPTLKVEIYKLVRELRNCKSISVKVDMERTLSYSLLITPSNKVKMFYPLFRSEFFVKHFYNREMEKVENYSNNCCFSISDDYLSKVKEGLQKIKERL